VKKAEADFGAAALLGGGRDALPDQVCFHCQQSAERYLKALMEKIGLTVPRRHNLISLLPQLTPHHSSLRSLRRGLDFLTRFAVQTRYPGASATKRQATAALRWAAKVRTAACSLLGLRLRRPRKRRKRGILAWPCVRLDHTFFASCKLSSALAGLFWARMTAATHV
jgi:HEPN domain-containing protein